LLAACGNNPPAPAGEQPAPQPAAEAPATPATAAPAAAADAAPLFGTWGFDAPACSAPIRISATAFEGAENSCEITALADNGDGTFTAALACAGQGESADEAVVMEPIFGPVGEGIRLTYPDRGGEPVLVFRCTAPRAE
jgi:hypothetical protein